jgi:hypothetical protein
MSTFTLHGKSYWEVYIGSTNNGPYDYPFALIVSRLRNYYGGFKCGNLAWFEYGSGTYNSVSGGVGSVLQFAYDADTGKSWFGVNGTWIGSGDPAAGTGEQDTVPASDKSEMTPYAMTYGNGDSLIYNFGQDSSFAGNKTAQGNTDDNGYGDFYYAPPSGYLALCTANLPDPVASIDPAKNGSPQDHFNAVLWSGNGSSQSITGVGFQPDFVWIKNRNQAYGYNWNHVLQDVLRGTGNTKIYSNDSGAEGIGGAYGHLSSFDSDGFSLSKTGTGSYDYAQTNASGGSYVGWNWKAGGSGVSNTDGSITSTVSANTDAGFSIATYAGNASGGSTIGHGLGVSPAMVMIKSNSNTTNWMVWHKDLATNYAFEGLNTTGAAAYGGSPSKFVRAVSSTTVMIGNDISVNQSSSYTYVMYAFAEVDSFSKFGVYTGNGSTDNAFVYTGFAPAFVIIKKDGDGNNWLTHDIYRDTTNQNDVVLFPNDSSAEATNTGYGMDMLSNGFKIRASGGEIGSSGGTYIYMAFAENPFKYANAR